MSSPTSSPTSAKPKPGRATARLGKSGLVSSASRTPAITPRPVPSTRSAPKTTRTTVLTTSAARISPRLKTVRVTPKLHTATASSKAKTVPTSSKANVASPAPVKVSTAPRRSIAQASPKLPSKTRTAKTASPKAKPASRKLPASPSKTQAPARTTTSSASRPLPTVRSASKATSSGKTHPAPTLAKAKSTTSLSAASKTGPRRPSVLSHAKTEPAPAAGGTIVSLPATPTVPSSRGARAGRSVGWAV